jgi:ketosteroid isomerase-like protein
MTEDLQANVDVVLRVLRRFSEQDVDAALEDVGEDATLDWSNSEALDSGVYEGHGGWRAFFAARDEVLGERRFDDTEMIPVADAVVLCARVREQGRVSGVAVESRGAAVWTLRDGKVTRLELYQSREEALAAVGLEA